MSLKLNFKLKFLSFFSGWLADSEYPELTYLTELVKAVTNLSLDTAEEWQVANYGIGGQYDPHFDFARVRLTLKTI